MPTPPVSVEVSLERKSAIESALRDGFSPFRESGGRGSSVAEAARRLSIKEVALTSWLLRQQSLRADGKSDFEPDWSLYQRYRREPSDEECAESIRVWELKGRKAASAAAALQISLADLRWNIRIGQERERQKAVGQKAMAGMVVRERSVALDESGALQTEWLKEGPAPNQALGGIDEGPARDGGEGYLIKGVSTLFDGGGNVRGQWVKTQVDAQRMREIQLATAAAMSADLPRLAPIAMPTGCSDNLCNLYTLTDCHVGMLAWRKEGGSDWDLKIAEKTLMGCFSQMISAAPAARVGVVNQLGDFLHSDGLMPVTPTSGHILDQDGRFSKLVAVAIRVLRQIVDLALQRHEEVHLILAEGNHDMASSVWLRQMFKALYENEPRLTVDDSELPYYVFQHGLTLLAFHHGHLKKNDQLPLLFAAQFPKLWGATTKRYAHCGHRHHVEEKEHSGMTVTQHPTLASRDAYAARGGWLSERQATAITYHKDFGEVARATVCPEMLEGMQLR
jgi:hypothetical protein